MTELAQILYKDGAKEWLDFGGLDLIFKVTALYILKKSEPC